MSEAGLSINGKTFSAENPLHQIGEALRSAVAHLEIWLANQAGNVLSALVNADHGFLIWMTPDCPEGWHTCASDYPLDDPIDLAFQLANGQVDWFAADLCVPRAAVLKPFQEFWENGQRPSSVNWMYT